MHCHLLNVHCVNDVRQTEMHMASCFKLKEVLKIWKDINRQVSLKFRQNWFEQEVIHYVLISTNLLILFGIRKKYHSTGRNLLLHVFMERVIKLTEIIKNITVINYIQSVIHFVSMLTPYINKITVDHQWNFNITNQTLITYSAFIRYWRKIGSTMGEYVSHL